MGNNPDIGLYVILSVFKAKTLFIFPFKYCYQHSQPVMVMETSIIFAGE